MLTKRIIACLDVKDGKVVKGTRFRSHEVLGEIEELALRYSRDGIDELVLYDISASAEKRRVSPDWVERVARVIDIPFCVAGGIRSVEDARVILGAGADKVSINTPALEDPNLISRLALEFGSQCVVVGVDSQRREGTFEVHFYTGSETLSRANGRSTLEWVKEAQDRGAGEIVLNCMSQDGTGQGFDLEQLASARELLDIPLVASGGARTSAHFAEVFRKSHVDAALAAGAFHRGELLIPQLKRELAANGIEVRTDGIELE